MPPSSTNQTAIVTGAGHGTGAAIARTLAEAGRRVVVNDLNPDRAEAVAATIRDAGGVATPIAADVANKFQCVHLVERSRDAYGRIDILVNNAAVRPTATVLKMDEWAWTRCLDVALKGTFFMSQLCGRVMADENDNRGGLIINLSAVAGVEQPLADHAAYCAAQAAILGFSRECAREFATYNIRVHTLLRPLTPQNDALATAVLRLTQTPSDRHVVRIDEGA